MTVPDLIVTDGVRICISDLDGDDFINDLVSVLVSHPDGVQVRWRLPKRLMSRVDVCQIVAEEIQLELEERVQHVKRLGL